MENCSLLVLKPDAAEKRVGDYLAEKFVEHEIRVTEFGHVRFTLPSLLRFYGWESFDYPFELGAYLCTEPLEYWIVAGPRVIQVLAELKQEVRRMHQSDKLHTLMHCPDTEVEFLREYTVIQECKLTEIAQKTNAQVEVIVYHITPHGEPTFLLLHRTVKRGGFWQPITGNINAGERYKDAALRELREETGINTILHLVDAETSFSFVDDNRCQYDYVFAAEVVPGTLVQLSEEHIDYRWVTYDEAYRLLQWPGNRRALDVIRDFIRRKYGISKN